MIRTSKVKMISGAVVVVVALVFAGAAFLFAVRTNHDRGDQLCEFVDDEHNHRRADILRGEADLYTKYAKNFSTFIDTAEKRRQIHEANKRAYNAVVKTRPKYCAQVRKNPVKPYPPLSRFR